MKVLVLGAGAVGTVSALKFVQDAMLEQLVIADAVSVRASLLADRLSDPRVSSRRLDAGDRTAVANAIRASGTTLVLNAALPATNLTRGRKESADDSNGQMELHAADHTPDPSP